MTALLIGSVALSSALLAGALGLFIKARARERASRDLPEVDSLVKKLRSKASHLQRQIYQLEAQKRRAEHALNLAIKARSNPENVFSMEVGPSDSLSDILTIADIELAKLAAEPGVLLTVEIHVFDRDGKIDLKTILHRASHAQMVMLFTMYKGKSLRQVCGEDDRAVSYDVQVWLAMQGTPEVGQPSCDGPP